MDFDQYMFKSITTNLENMTKFNNLSGRDINDINAYTRSFGIDVPRGLVYGSGSERLDKQLMQSRLTQSGIGFISGLEQMTSEQRKLVKRETFFQGRKDTKVRRAELAPASATTAFTSAQGVRSAEPTEGTTFTTEL